MPVDKSQKKLRGNTLLPIAALIMAIAALGVTVLILFRGQGIRTSFLAQNSSSAVSAVSYGAVSSQPDSLSSAAVSDAFGANSALSAAGSGVSSAALTSSYSDTALDKPDAFQNALFVGDAITEGIHDYKMLSKPVIAYSNGLSSYSALKSKVEYAGGEATVSTIAAKAKPSKIYILLGSNDVSFLSSARFTKYYGELLDSLAKSCPNAKIYVQSIFPVSAAYAAKHTDASNSKINEYNTALQQMCSGKTNVRYLDVASVLRGGDGALRAELAAGGVNIERSAYYLWLNYLSANS